MFSRAGRFGTKGLAITFVSSEADETVMAQIQARFEVAVPVLPDKIDSASYSECICGLICVTALSQLFTSDVLMAMSNGSIPRFACLPKNVLCLGCM